MDQIPVLKAFEIDIAQSRLPQKSLREIVRIILPLSAAIALFLIVHPSFLNGWIGYLPLHTFIEGFSIVIAMLVFTVGWNTYSKDMPGNAVMLACAFLAVGLVDFAHLFSYPGMPDFVTPSGTDKAIYFTLAVKWILNTAVLAAVLLPWKVFSFKNLRCVFLIGSLTLVGIIYWLVLFHDELLPDTFVPGKGLTSVKIGAEYLIFLLHFFTVFILLGKYRKPQPFDTGYLLISVVILILSDLCFALYVDPTDELNLLGHLYLTAAYYFIYRAMFVHNVEEPFRRMRQSEQALRKSREYFLTTLFSIHDAVITTDAEGRITFMNPTAEKLTGYSLDHAAEKRITEVFHVINEENPVIQVIRKEEEIGLKADSVVKPRNGAEIFVQSSAAPIQDDAENLVGVVLVFRDITEQRRTEDSQKRLAAIVESTTDFVATSDSQGRVLYYNKAAREMLGISVNEDITSIKITDTHPEWANQIVLNVGLPTAAQDGVWKGETAFLNRNGRQIPVSQVILAHKTPNGNVEYYSTIARDIMELRKAEEKQRLAARIIENISEGAMVTDADSVILSVNPAFTAISGYSEEEVFGSSPSILSSGKHSEEFYNSMWSLLKETGKWHGEIWNKRKNGELYLEEITISSVKDDQRNVIHYVALFKDITERKRTEELLQKSDRLSAVGQLAAGIAHEIRNPLTSLRGFLQLLMEKSDINRQYSEIMLSELDRINLIVSELLVLAKPQVASFQQKDVQVLLQNVITLLDAQAILSNIQIKADFEADIPLIKCEENQLKQVFINILKNAIDAMPNGGNIEIQVKKRDPHHITVRIADQGCGIPEERIPQLGEPYYTTKEKGTGLGLMVSYKIIRDHRGSIHVTSRINEGTAIEITLPVNT